MDYILEKTQDKQISMVPCFIKSIAINAASATYAVLYNEANATHTDGKQRFTIRCTDNGTTVIIFPGRGLRFETACALDWVAGEVYYAMG